MRSSSDGLQDFALIDDQLIIGTDGNDTNIGRDGDDLLMGGASIDAHGTPLTDETMAEAMTVDAALHGAVGGPNWDDLPFAQTPERGLLRLRKLLADLRSAVVLGAIAEASTLKLDEVAALDLMIVRELTGGQGGNDVLTGNASDDTVLGGEGDDTVLGGEGDDTVLGGEGDDTVLGGEGDDTVLGGEGDDSIVGGLSDGDEGSDGDDTVSFENTANGASVDLGNESATGLENGDDTVTDIENVFGGAGDDTLTGDAGDNVLWGNDGNDLIDGADGDDTLVGGGGDDTIDGGDGNDLIYGDSAAGIGDVGLTIPVVSEAAGFILMPNGDNLNEPESDGGDATDLNLEVFGESGVSKIWDVDSGHVFAGIGATSYFSEPVKNPGGFDHMMINGGLETIGQQTQGWEDLPNLGDQNFIDASFPLTLSHNLGLPGNDLLMGGAGDDTIFGNEEQDTLQGGVGDDLLDGNAGNDSLQGGGGGDTLIGGTGDDRLDGGNGDDRFVFADGAGKDKIVGFAAGAGTDDVVDLTGVSGFGTFAEVLDAATQVSSNTKIDLGGDNTLTLLGVDVADLNEDDFIL